MEITWKPLAQKDLVEIITYIYLENPQAARDVFAEVQEQVKMLAEHPQLGRSGRVSKTRELVIVRTPYLVSYRIVDNTVNILRVVHGAQKWPRKFSK